MGESGDGRGQHARMVGKGQEQLEHCQRVISVTKRHHTQCILPRVSERGSCPIAFTQEGMLNILG